MDLLINLFNVPNLEESAKVVGLLLRIGLTGLLFSSLFLAIRYIQTRSLQGAIRSLKSSLTIILLLAFVWHQVSREVQFESDRLQHIVEVGSGE